MNEQTSNADEFSQSFSEHVSEVISAEELQQQYGPASTARNLDIVQERRRKAARVKSGRSKAR